MSCKAIFLIDLVQIAFFRMVLKLLSQFRTKGFHNWFIPMKIWTDSRHTFYLREIII